MFDELKKKLQQFVESNVELETLAKAKVDQGLTPEDKRAVRTIRNPTNTSGSSLSGNKHAGLAPAPKGVHMPISPGSGESMTGASLRGFQPKQTGFNKLQEKRTFMTGVKDQHKKILNHLKSMKKPDLAASELDKNVHNPKLDIDPKGGTSEMGRIVRVAKQMKSPDAKKEMNHEAAVHSIKNKEKLQSSPKPNLPKSEDMSKSGECWDGYKRVSGTKAYDKGSCEPVSKTVHQQHSMAPKGTSVAGHDYRIANKAKQDGRKDILGYMKASINAHKENLARLKETPAPNLPKSEKPSGGTLDYRQLKQEYKEKARTMPAPGRKSASPIMSKPQTTAAPKAAPQQSGSGYGKLYDPGMSGNINYKKK